MKKFKWTADDVTRITVNPFYAINIAPVLAMEHEVMVDREEWVKANLNIIREIGTKRWLHTLLEVLEGNYPGGSDSQR